ncbi:MAG: HipA family kinase [Flavisolibacter sp.]
MDALRTVDISRYVTPLREGGSLPAIVEAGDGFLYVLKFRGAGQGIKALVAELIGGEVARVLGFRIPEIVLAQVDPAFGRTEPDEEIQDLLKASGGLNLALHYLSGAISFDPVVNQVDAQTASRIVWMDALLTNVDRTARNTNMLMWRKELWLIDHGAALYFHHAGNNWEQASLTVFPQVKDHVLLPWASEMQEADSYCRTKLTGGVIRDIIALIPNEWLPQDIPVEAGRKVYENFLLSRINQSTVFINQIQNARKALI